MAHHVEPMDIDSDFDNKENSLHHNNVLPFTEKGYEELDVSELNMKLRYSITPASSPMSKSFTAVCPDNRTLESGDDSLNVAVSGNTNLTRSLNSTMTKNDSIVKSLKALPLQSISTDQFADTNRSSSVLRSLDTTITPDSNNIIVTVSGPNDIDENSSLPSSSSSTLQTPEATTPTKEIPIKDGGSPIMRGLKTVLNMFRSSQSPIPPADNENVIKQELLSPVEEPVVQTVSNTQPVLASTPISSHRKKEMSPTKRNSPQKDSTIIFNDDLEKELQWKDETTIIFSEERIPIHKLMLQQPLDKKIFKEVTELPKQNLQDLNSTVEYMDISYNDSFRDKTLTDVQDIKQDSILAAESDSEFQDCETTFTKNESVTDDHDKTQIAEQFNVKKDAQKKNDSGSRLKPIILDTTQDILDATLSVRPEDLIPDRFNQTRDVSTVDFNKTEVLNTSKEIEESSLEMCQQPFNQTVNITNPLTSEPPTDNFNATKTIELLASQSINQTIEAPCPLITQKLERDNLVGIEITDNLLDASQQFEDQYSIFDVMDTTMTNATMVLENTFDIDSKTETANDKAVNANIEPEICETVSNSEVTVSPVFVPAPLKEAINIPLPDIDSNNDREHLLAKLPVDVPLPDEDDIEKEMSLPTTEASPLLSLPLDLVDDIRAVPEVIEIEEVKAPSTESPVNNDVCVLPEVCAVINTPTVEDVVNKQFDTDSASVVEVAGDNLEQSVDVNEISDINNGTENVQVLPDVDFPPKVIENEILEALESNINEVIDKNTTVSTEETVDFNKLADNIQLESNISVPNLVQDQDVVVSMDINDSVCELKPLPDIINQTITAPSKEDLDSNAIAVEVVVGEQIKTEQENDINLTCESIIPEVVPEVKNDIDQIPSVQEPIIETTKNTEVKLHVTVTEIGILPQELTSVVSAPTPDNIVLTENAIDAVSNQVHLELKDTENPDAELLGPVTIIPTTDADDAEISEAKEVEEEVLLSENNSPFVSVIAANVPGIEFNESATSVENVEDPVEIKAEIASPSSPPIKSKGYNFNFDDMDFNPFATKTMIRMSPPLESPNKTFECNTEKANVKTVENPKPKKDFNRRKSQPERKKPTAPKRKFNATFDGAVSDKIIDKSPTKLVTELKEEIQLASPVSTPLDPNNVTIEENNVIESNAIPIETADSTTPCIDVDMSKGIVKTEPESTLKQVDEQSTPLTEDSEPSAQSSEHDVKATSSSEHSTYFSACTSSSESNLVPRNVFNLPEIDDVNFNPFATKSKMRQSPPPSLDVENPFATKSKIKSSPETSMITSEDKIESEPMEKDASGNLSNTTVSSKATDDRNVTTREIHTEDEDTIEGPFLESEDLNSVEKMADFCSENDMMLFNELPTKTNEDNIDSGEMFIDAEAFEFLLNQNKSNTVADSGKESLFLKFDPLFAKRMSAITSDGVVASLAKLQKRQSTPTKATPPTPKNMPSPVAGPSNVNLTQDMDVNISEEFNDDLNITVSKPMMVVPPAVNPVTPRNKSITPNRTNRRSITFTSPAMAVIDRLLSLSGNNSLLHETTVTQVSREQSEADIALSQLRELLAEKEINVYNLKSESNELKDRLSTLECQVKSLEVEGQDRLKKINQLNDTLAEKTKINKSMAAVVEEYERTIASLIAETAQDKKRHAEERIKLINERDEQTAHLASMEVSFSDLHSKYEKSKQVIFNCKANEDIYKKSIKEFEENLSKIQNNYELLKQHATSKLNHANQELEKMNRSHEAEVLKLNAMLKRRELHITSLEESLTQKTKANEELTAICDELINKVG